MSEVLNRESIMNGEGRRNLKEYKKRIAQKREGTAPRCKSCGAFLSAYAPERAKFCAPCWGKQGEEPPKKKERAARKAPVDEKLYLIWGLGVLKAEWNKTLQQIANGTDVPFARLQGYVGNYGKTNKPKGGLTRAEVLRVAQFFGVTEQNVTGVVPYRIGDTKSCSTCGEKKDLTGFHHDEKKADGRKSRCKACSSRIKREERSA